MLILGLQIQEQELRKYSNPTQISQDGYPPSALFHTGVGHITVLLNAVDSSIIMQRITVWLVIDYALLEQRTFAI